MNQQEMPTRIQRRKSKNNFGFNLKLPFYFSDRKEVRNQAEEEIMLGEVKSISYDNELWDYHVREIEQLLKSFYGMMEVQFVADQLTY
jgi:hypothetical protein